MKLNGVIFDLDGTLIDSMYIWNDLSFDLLCQNGITPRDDLRDKVSTMYLEQSSRYVIEEYGLPYTVEEVNRYINERVESFYLHEVQPKRDILPFLERLKAAGVPMCVATATERRLALPALEHNGMLPYFTEKALRRLGTEKDHTAVFEDSLHAVSTAKAAGFPAFTIFDESSAHNKEKLIALSDRYFYRYAELDGCFDNL